MSLTIAHTPAEGTLIEGTTRGDGTAVVLKATGWRWAPTLGAWHVPRTRDHAPNSALIRATADRLRAAGHDVDVQVDDTRRSAAEVEAATQERARVRAAALDAKADAARARAARAESAQQTASDRLPDNGQPILIGHHSEPAHRRAIARADAAMRRSIDAAQGATEATRRAEVAAHTSSARHNPVTVANRIDRLEAELRSAQRDGRTERAVDLADQVAYWTGVRQTQIDTGAVIAYGPETVKTGDAVKIRGRWHEVVRANRKTVSVPSTFGSWTDTAPWHEVADHRTAEQTTAAATA